MTKEEAIKYLNEFILFKKISNTTEDEAVECFKLAVDALEQQPNEDEKVIRIKKGTLKARTGRFVVYDVEWLKTHFNTTEAKIYGQSNVDYISRKETIDALKQQAENMLCWSGRYTEQRKGILIAINIVSDLLSVTPQSKEESQQKTGHWIEHKHGGIEHIECSECGIWFLKADLPRKSYCPNCGSCNRDMIKNIMRDITKTMSGGTK